MKQWKIVLFSFMFLFFTYHSVVFAHEGEGEEAENYLKDFSTDEHDHSEEITNQESHDHTDSAANNNSHDHSTTHDDAGGEHSTFDGEETGPNKVVLLSFATINAAFLLIGIWNKWRKRGVNHGTN
jgi:hypothetical protein